jgi:hypothetical protein
MGLLLVTVALVFLFAEIESVAIRAHPASLMDRQRFGFVATTPGWREKFDLSQLGAGWAIDFAPSVCSTRPGGIDRAIVIYVWPGYVLDPEELGPMVDNHPGSLWIVGNEPDCIRQGNLEPDVYVQMYHDVYTFIKGRDDSAQLSAAGIVQATPLRLEYLDRVLTEYQRAYTEPMPVDVWNIHNVMVNEQRGEWGADIPPGIDADEGVVRSPGDADNMELFEQQILTFRQWMSDTGYGGYPLVITEYGVLSVNGYSGMNEDRVKAFMTNSFEFLSAATDPDLGDPDDGYRLVQRWAWFSLDWPDYDPILAPQGFNGGLFNPFTSEITDYGLHYASLISNLPILEHVDLSPGAFRSIPETRPDGTTGPMTRTVYLEIQNDGNVDSGPFTVELEYDGPVSGVLDQGVSNVPPASSHWLTFTLSALDEGKYLLSIWIDSQENVTESTECNNQLSWSIAVPPELVFLPIVLRDAR